jgi:hypothetical protein
MPLAYLAPAQGESETHPRIGPVLVDVIVTEKFSADAEVTEHPVERGVDIADHIRRKPDSLSVDGVVSDAPLVPGGDVAGNRFLAPFVDGNRGDRARAALLELFESAALVEVVTPKRIYRNLALTKLETTVDRSSGGAFRFSATFRQVRFVHSAIAPPSSKPAAAGAVDVGTQSATPATPQQAQRARAPLKRFFDWANKGAYKITDALSGIGRGGS